MTELLKISEVAARLRCSRRQVFRYMADGRLRYLKPSPRKTLVKASEVEAFIAAASRRPA